MANKVLSIEISNSLIRMVEMDYKKKNPRVYRHAVFPTPPGVIKDGYLQGITTLRDVIKSALNEYKMKSTKDVIFTVASSKIVTREVVLPPVKPNMVESLIKSNLNEYFPIDLSTYDIAHIILEQFADGPDKGKYRAMIMAADKSLVNGYDELATMCGLKLVSLDYAGNSIFQSIRREETANHVMVLKIEEGQTTVSILKNKNLMLQRSINYGLDEAINETVNQPVFNVNTYDEAWDLLKRKTCIKFNVSETAMKNSMNRDLSTDIETRDFDESQEIREAKIEVTKSLETFISSIRRVIEFYSSRNGGEELERVLITGTGGAMSGLAKLITNELGIRTTVVNRLEGVSYYVTSEDAGIFNFVSCIGATFHPVGFISKEKKAKQKKETDFTPFSIVVALIAVLICAGMVIISSMNIKEAEKERDSLLAQQEKYKKGQEVYIQYTNLLTLHGQVAAGHSMTACKNDNILNFFTELETILPSDVLISSFRSDNAQVIMSVSVSDKDTAAGVITKIRGMQSIKHITVPSIAENGQGAVSFTITAVYK